MIKSSKKLWRHHLVSQVIKFHIIFMYYISYYFYNQRLKDIQWFSRGWININRHEREEVDNIRRYWSCKGSIQTTKIVSYWNTFCWTSWRREEGVNKCLYSYKLLSTLSILLSSIVEIATISWVYNKYRIQMC